MKALVCELCGSNDVVKEGDYFICKHCGTKYSVETAKQMMFGGSVSIDRSKEIENLKKNIDLYIANNDWDGLQDISKKILAYESNRKGERRGQERVSESDLSSDRRSCRNHHRLLHTSVHLMVSL